MPVWFASTEYFRTDQSDPNERHYILMMVREQSFSAAIAKLVDAVESDKLSKVTRIVASGDIEHRDEDGILTDYDLAPMIRDTENDGGPYAYDCGSVSFAAEAFPPPSGTWIAIAELHSAQIAMEEPDYSGHFQTMILQAGSLCDALSALGDAVAEEGMILWGLAEFQSAERVEIDNAQTEFGVADPVAEVLRTGMILPGAEYIYPREQ